jgi:hypothetical protein
MAGMLLQEIVSGLGVLLALAGLAVCALHLRRSRWVGLLMAGFALEALLSAFYTVAAVALPKIASSGASAMASVGAVYLAASLLHLVARGAIVGGVAGALSQLPSAPAPRPQP